MTGARRREVLVGLSAALAGCSHDAVPLLSADPPPLVGAWFEVTATGDGEFLLAFDGDVQSLLDRAPFDESDLVDVADDEGVDLSFEPVDVAVPDGQAPGEGALADERTVQGRITGFARTLDWPVHTWYSTKKVTYEKELPEEADAPLYLRFPNGYQYELPADHGDAAGYGDGEGLFSYGGSAPERTFPTVQHYAHPDLLAMRLAAEYRFTAISESYRLFTWGHYEGRMYEAAREGVSELMATLGEAAVESVVTSPLPGDLTAPLDVMDVHDALQADLPKLEGALESIEQASEASVNNSWMADITPDSGAEEDPERDGLGQLAMDARREFEYRNPTVATTNDNDAFIDAVEAYERLVADQRAIPSRLLSPDSVFTSVGTFGIEYWDRLHDYGRTLLRESDRLLREEAATLEQLKDDVS